MLARQQADSSYGGFAKLASFFFFLLFSFFYFPIWAPRVFMAVAMGGGLMLGPS